MHRRLAAFRHAFVGGLTLVRTQAHAKLHLLATLVVTVAGTVVGLSTTDWCLVVVSMAIVWAAEALNTAIELLADEVSLEHRERIKHAKDVAAFAVLTAAIAAAIVGGVVFYPHLKV